MADNQQNKQVKFKFSVKWIYAVRVVAFADWA